MLVCKDGYIFDYLDDKDNRKMKAIYNKMLKSIHKIKLLEFSTNGKLDFLGTCTADTPLYLFSPKTNDDIKSLINLDDKYATLFGDKSLEINKKYILRFEDDIGDFSIVIYPIEEAFADLQNFINLKNEITNN